MNAKDLRYGKYKDENGESYYCPVSLLADDHIVSESELEDCVEVSTAGRYSGNLKVIN